MSLGTNDPEEGGFREINMTPMVDVMLVLLIIFMVTAPMLTTGLRVELPDVHAANVPVKDEIPTVVITKDERVFLDDRDITDSVEEVMLTDSKIQTRHEIYIQADKAAHYEVVARVVAAAQAAQVTGLNLLVEPKSGVQPRASASLGGH